MSAEIVTTEDLKVFRTDLLEDIKKVLVSHEERTAKPQWIKTTEVRRLLKISAGSLQSLRSNGSLPYSRIGHLIYYNYNDIEKILKQNTIDNSKHVSRRKNKIR